MMKRSYFYLLTTLIFSFSSLLADRRVSTLIIPHSQSVDAARELAGWENYVNVNDTGHAHGAFAITPEATLSFRPERVAQCFFGNAIIECDNTFTVGGSQTANRTNSEWLADYFGLPTDFESSVYVDPKVSQALVDFAFQVESTQFIPGLYFRIHAPLVYAKWDLNMCETLISTGTNAYDTGYFNATGIDRVELLDNFTSFISGRDAPKVDGLTFNQLKKKKIDCKSHTLLKLSDIQIALGYNILKNKQYHLGFNLRCSIPTGNTPTAEYLFEPIIGNGHHWELGGGLSSHVIVWKNDETEEHAGIYFDMNLTHMFATDQCRSFDLCTGHNSRYMLAQKMDTDIEHNLRGNVDGALTEPNYQFAQEVSTVANLTTLAVKVSSAVQVDLALMLGYKKAKNSWGFGYGFWGRSCESIKLPKERIAFEKEKWALKGDAYVFGFADTAAKTPVALSTTQSDATLNHGTNFPKAGATTQTQINQGRTNEGSDNPALALADTNDDSFFEALHTTPDGSIQINTSIQPVILTRDDIDRNSARTRGIAHKIFSHFTHTITLENSTPYLSIGAEIEFGQTASNCNIVKIGDPPCVNTALSYWGVWLKGGLAF